MALWRRIIVIDQYTRGIRGEYEGDTRGIQGAYKGYIGGYSAKVDRAAAFVP